MVEAEADIGDAASVELSLDETWDSMADYDSEFEFEESESPQLPSPSSSVESLTSEPIELPKVMLDASRTYFSQTVILEDKEGEEAADASKDNGGVVPPSPWILDVGDLSISEQEQVVLQELFYVLNGAACDIITVHKISNENIGFHLHENIHHTLRDVTMNIAQVGAYYHRVQKFIEIVSSMEYGKVNQALAEGMKQLLQEYHLRICQLETIFSEGELTLLEFWFHFHETAEQMSSMCEIVIEIEKEKARGGRTLTILHEIWVKSRCEPISKLTCHRLATTASLPYFRIIEKWMYKGIIEDPFKEFFISHGDITGCNADAEFNPSDEYWKTRYDYDLAKCPNFLVKMGIKIYRAGKYLNVLLQCAPDTELLKEEQISFSVQACDYKVPIETPYAFASLALLKLMETKYDLRRKFRTVKGILFMEQGDFITDLLDLTRDELCKPYWEMNRNRMETLLEWALHTCSSTAVDPYKDNLKVQLFSGPIQEMFFKVIGNVGVSPGPNRNNAELESLPGIRMFSIRCEFEWPVSIIFNKETVESYQMISRHLLYCKYVERRLIELWCQEKNQKKINLQLNLEQAARFSLRHKMLSYVQNLLYYSTMEVIDQAWQIFMTTMETADSLDRVMRLHSIFLKSVLQDSMLNNADLLERMTGLLTMCLQFCNKFSNNPPTSTSREENPVNNGTAALDKEFSEHLLKFLRAAVASLIGPKRSRKIINLVYRMNLNGYYSTSAILTGIIFNSTIPHKSTFSC